MQKRNSDDPEQHLPLEVQVFCKGKTGTLVVPEYGPILVEYNDIPELTPSKFIVECGNKSKATWCGEIFYKPEGKGPQQLILVWLRDNGVTGFTPQTYTRGVRKVAEKLEKDAGAGQRPSSSKSQSKQQVSEEEDASPSEGGEEVQVLSVRFMGGQ